MIQRKQDLSKNAATLNAAGLTGVCPRLTSIRHGPGGVAATSVARADPGDLKGWNRERETRPLPPQKMQ